MTFEHPDKPAFVPKGDDRRATARVLVDLADEHGISQSSIQSANDGFYISEELADLLHGPEDAEPEPEPEPQTPVSGNTDTDKTAEATADATPSKKNRK